MLSWCAASIYLPHRQESPGSSCGVWADSALSSFSVPFKSALFPFPCSFTFLKPSEIRSFPYLKRINKMPFDKSNSLVFLETKIRCELFSLIPWFPERSRNLGPPLNSPTLLAASTWTEGIFQGPIQLLSPYSTSQGVCFTPPFKYHTITPRLSTHKPSIVSNQAFVLRHLTVSQFTKEKQELLKNEFLLFIFPLLSVRFPPLSSPLLNQSRSLNLLLTESTYSQFYEFIPTSLTCGTKWLATK